MIYQVREDIKYTAAGLTGQQSFSSIEVLDTYISSENVIIYIFPKWIMWL